MNVTDEDIIVDHIDKNPKNNKLSNLRISNGTNNNHNKTKSPNATSKYYGVSYKKSKNIYEASIRKDGNYYYIGSYDNEIDAAYFYNIKANELYGDYANLNNISKDYIPNIIKKEQTSKFIGVFFDKSSQKYRSCIIKDKKRYHLGYFDNEIKAAEAYNKKSKELNGDKAKLNDIPYNIEIAIQIKKTSKFRGVSFDKKAKKYRTQISKNKKNYILGYFDNELEAAETYNKKALELYGDKAKLNVI